MELAHSENSDGISESLVEHLSTVAHRCRQLGKPLKIEEEAFCCGLLHDLGKLGKPFQERLQGKRRRVNHWSFGAHKAIDSLKRNGAASAIAINGHHTGLEVISAPFLKKLYETEKLVQSLEKQGQTLSRVEPETATKWLQSVGFDLPKVDESILPYSQVLGSKHPAAEMANLRMLYSVLVDSDFLETEAHFQGSKQGRYKRPARPELDPEKAHALLAKHLNLCRKNTVAPKSVVSMRDDLMQACLEASEQQPGLFTLTAPTGCGKTLSMLAFALKHAREHSLRRIVLVIPFLSIIEQTAAIYREIFQSKFAPDYLLEHHSLVTGSATDTDDENREAESRIAYQAKLQAENWDAPIIITTNIQFFESLFSNRPGACRKLHRLANSVILFDEVQTFPTNLAIPTLATLSQLATRFDSTIVFATATQPAFPHMDKEVRKIGGHGWRPKEIVPEKLHLFERAKRVEVQWPLPEETRDWGDLAEELADEERVLCVVNLKRHAIDLLEELSTRAGQEGLFHLSTNMCPRHRTRVLEEVRQRLARPDALCRLVATQCIEAGVDVDFPVAYRAMGPLESIAQVAGRCNRNGRLRQGRVRVFIPTDEAYPQGGGYAQAAQQTKNLLGSEGSLDIDDPKLFQRYFKTLYNLQDFQKEDKVIPSILDRNFVETAKHYRWIKGETISVVTPYDQRLYEELLAEAQERGISSTWRKKAHPLAVSLYRDSQGQRGLEGYLEPVPLFGGEHESAEAFSDEWFFLIDEEGDLYDSKLFGLVGTSDRFWIA